MAVLLSSCYSPTERPPERRGVVWPLRVAGSSKRGTPGRLKAAAAAAPRGVRLPPSCRVEAPLAVRLSATGVLACEARREAFSAASRSTILLSCGWRGRQWGGRGQAGQQVRGRPVDTQEQHSCPGRPAARTSILSSTTLMPPRACTPMEQGSRVGEPSAMQWKLVRGRAWVRANWGQAAALNQGATCTRTCIGGPIIM